ncbi:hypothetical protein DQ237_15610 [Blastococcus sp. TF02-8]|uniref:hypothetical protein n=1 Tax=Blastococcus sp. TF02-8 TaxID=2250574 RepID=UPI000DEA0F10|nr:hypothetical protein [Blastococcus sp. TF02-8]RBY95123.1 hypothetical protein DQ237_15610 [Blastococcus sp. TF02-8]
MSMGRPRPRVLLVVLLLVACTVGWRRGQYFTGSLDPVVLAKAALSVLALVLAARAPGARRRLGTGSLWALAMVLALSVLGALTHGTFLAGGLVAARVAVLGLAVFCLLRAVPVEDVLVSLAWSCGLIGAAAVVSGLPSAASGRLAGEVPPLAPNELALLAGVVVLVAAWRCLLGAPRPTALAAAAVGLAVIWATGSRTGLLVLVLALGVVALHARRVGVGLVVSGLLMAALGSVAVLATGALGEWLERDGDGVSTLESRFIAWRAATTWAGSLWQTLFGGGLSVKIIEVRGQWWTTQPLDSSWVSLLVQCGVVGVLVALGWVLWAVRGALLAPRRHRALVLGMLAFLVPRSVLESGLFDATPAFLCFLVVSLAVEGGSRRRLLEEEGAAPAAPSDRARPVAAPA